MFTYVFHKLSAFSYRLNLANYSSLYTAAFVSGVCADHLVQSDDKIAQLTPATLPRHPMNDLEASSLSLRALGGCIASASGDRIGMAA
jgi:hypothetical protein